jgi:hypothetical protein
MSETPDSNLGASSGGQKIDPIAAQGVARPARIYVIKSFTPAQKTPAMDAGRGGRGGCAPPASALIHQKRHSGIEIAATGEKTDAERCAAVGVMIQQMPGRLRKKMFALRERIEWMVREYGIEHVGLQTLTIRENVTDGKEFNKRFKSISTNVFPKLFLDWIRVYERQKRGAWHVHVVVATKANIRAGSNPDALNKLLKDRNERRIPKSTYYAGLQRYASPNLRAIWKEFRRLCGIREFKQRRKSKGKRYYKFDACHLLPIISTPQALAVYVSKYISKGFENRKPEDKGMRLVGCSKRVSRICSEKFSWAEGVGSLWRTKLAVLAEMLNFQSTEEFATKFGSKWAYHLRSAIDILLLPHYANMRLARADGWDLVNTADGSPWPWVSLDLPKTQVQESRTQSFRIVQNLIARRRGKSKFRSRAEMAWDPERYEEIKSRTREYKVFKPPQKPRVLIQDEFLGLDPPQIIKD